MVRVVIFDLDDTLISEKMYIESGYRHISKFLLINYGLNENEIYNRLIELLKASAKNVFDRLIEEYKHSFNNDDIPDLIKELVQQYRNHLPDITFYPDVMPCINYLNEKCIRKCIITDGYAVTQRQKLKTLKADVIFDEIIVTDEIGREYWKPHPKAFEIIAENADVDYNQMIYIGDNPEKDFHIAKNYPIITVRIKRDGVYNNRQYLENIKENFTIECLDEIKSLIEQL